MYYGSLADFGELSINILVLRRYVVGEAMIEEEGSDDKQGQQEAEKAEGEGSGCDQRGLWLRLRLLRRKAATTSKGSRKQRRLKGGEGTEVAGECCGVWGG
ncbi:hypothetical protein B296_00023028 [Ensete ventricosum]|uniref:Uncharacterized protein n=1 Tax=Ensete ventricosum TaxID=4639 RepID=A0A426YIC7_ENSVE|nr:hypothetical protein B296_00023028 [Ensete ventricosum]